MKFFSVKNNVVYLVLGLLTFAAYLPVLNNDFINFDDEDYVTNNAIVQRGLTVEGFKWAFTTGHASNWHPLTWLSHMLDCRLFGLDPGMHHMTSLLFHIFNTLLLLYLLHYATGSFWPSVLVSALFALHPLHVESVAWVSERKDVLSSFFFFLTLIAYVRYSKQRSVMAYAAMFCLFALGLMSKPMLVTVPFVLLLLDYWPLERLQAVRRSFVKLVIEKLPLFALSFASCVVTFIVQRTASAMPSYEIVSLSNRFSNTIVSYKDYIFKMCFPHDLAILYPYPVDGISVQNIILSFAVIIMITAVIVFFVSSRRYFLVGWFWFLGMLVPVIGLVQVGIQSMADRYTYLPSIGIFIIAAWTIKEIAAMLPKSRTILNVSMLALIALMARGTYVQAGYWKDSAALYEHTINVTPENPKIYYNYGLFLSQKGEIDSAIDYFERTVNFNPFGDAYNNLGNCMRIKGEPDRAIEYYQKALETDPSHSYANYNIAIMYHKKRQYSKAVHHFKETLRLNPEISKTLNYLAWILATANDPDSRDPEQAVEFALQLCQRSEYKEGNAIDTLAVAYAAAGDFDSAVKYARLALDIARSSNNTSLIEEVTSHLALFKQGKPYVEP